MHVLCITMFSFKLSVKDFGAFLSWLVIWSCFVGVNFQCTLYSVYRQIQTETLRALLTDWQWCVFFRVQCRHIALRCRYWRTMSGLKFHLKSTTTWLHCTSGRETSTKLRYQLQNCSLRFVINTLCNISMYRHQKSLLGKAICSHQQTKIVFTSTVH